MLKVTIRIWGGYPQTMSDGPAEAGTVPWAALREALRRTASALKADGLDYALGGGYALWVHGAPEPLHDVDFVVAESDVESAAATLADAGFTVARPVEDWLFKAFLDGALVDVLHRINGVTVDKALIETADVHDVLGVAVPVLSPTVVLTQTLLSLTEHHCDFEPLLPRFRAVRERVDWERLRRDTAGNDFAVAFLVLADRLGIAEAF
jgi:hypothetical protein